MNRNLPRAAPADVADLDLGAPEFWEEHPPVGGLAWIHAAMAVNAVSTTWLMVWHPLSGAEFPRLQDAPIAMGYALGAVAAPMRYAHVVPEMLAAAVHLLEEPTQVQPSHAVAATGRQDALRPCLITNEKDPIPYASLTTESRPEGRPSTWSG